MDFMLGDRLKYGHCEVTPVVANGVCNRAPPHELSGRSLRAETAMSWGKHKKILAMAKGYRGRANSCYRTAINRVEKGLQYQYRDRKQKKRVRAAVLAR